MTVARLRRELLLIAAVVVRQRGSFF